MTHPFSDPKVEAAFEVPDAGAKAGLLSLRDLIWDRAQALPQIGPLQETLRWGQPAYLTPQSRSGSTLRLGVPKTGRFALFVHCQSSLIADFLRQFPNWDRVEGTRAVLFDDLGEIDPIRHGWLIERALTYHLNKRAAKAAAQ